MKKYRIGILTGGGDCAGLNSALKWVVKTALDARLGWERRVQYEVLGIMDGWKGLINAEVASRNIQDSILILDEETVRQRVELVQWQDRLSTNSSRTSCW